MSGGKKVIIIKKKKGGHEGHHGGSWKVAYADFVTAMMAFFLVMWIMSMDQGVKDLVQGYFQNPVGFKRSFSGGRNILSQGNSITNLDIRRTVLLERRRQEEARFREAAEDIRTALDEGHLLDDVGAEVDIVVTDEGLRIEMMETGNAEVFFDRSSAELKPTLARVLRLIAERIGAMHNGIVVEGHTDATRFGRSGYSNWELSVDRANAARRILLDAGLGEERIVEVRGYADRHLRNPEDPAAAENRRISLLLPYDTPDLEGLEQRVNELLGRNDSGEAETSSGAEKP